MTLKRGIALLTCLVLLSACASFNKAPKAPAPPPALAQLLGDAERAGKAGQADKEHALLASAAAAYPADKEPWMRLAELDLQRQNHRAALNSAMEVLARDGEDKEAQAIVTLSALRLASASLTDLNRKNSWTGPMRTEAQGIAKSLFGAMGDPAKPAVARGTRPSPSVTFPKNESPLEKLLQMRKGESQL